MATNFKKCTSLVFMIMILVTACSGSEESKETVSTQSLVLKIYRLEYDHGLKNINKLFKQKYLDIEIDEKIFKNDEDYRTKLASELMAGEGPDVIKGDPMQFSSLQKLITNNIFYDLNTLISLDKEFNLDDYSSALQEVGVYKGERRFLITDYSFTMLYTTEDILKRNNINIDVTDDLT